MIWQPIETGPKDGSTVLLLYPHAGRKAWTGEYLVHEHYSNGKLTHQSEGWFASMMLSSEPTHWSPVPDYSHLISPAIEAAATHVVKQSSGMKLAAYLRENEIRPSAFAARIGVAPSTITRILNGERSPGLPMALRIREATGGQVTPDDFVVPQETAA